MPTFDYGAWSTRFPELAAPPGTGTVTSALASLYADEAALLLPSTNLVSDSATQAVLLNLATAHIAALNAGVSGDAATPLVGRISTATEGSVSVSTALDTPQSAAYWAQTKYGLQYWQMLAGYRTAMPVYAAGLTPPCGWGYQAWGYVGQRSWR